MIGFVFTSYGNDSVALIQWVFENSAETDKIYTVFSDTGWAAKSWEIRLAAAEQWVVSLGFIPTQLKSEGFAALAQRKKTFPRGMMQFCTHNLKIKPALEWMDGVDPAKQAVCFVGVRREESAKRARQPEISLISDNHGGRLCLFPLAAFAESERNELIAKTPMAVLEHRSMECSPCIFSSRKDLREFAKDENRVTEIENLETHISRLTGTERTLFRPKAYAGAKGIREIVRWAMSERGAYTPAAEDEEDCPTGYCGV